METKTETLLRCRVCRTRINKSPEEFLMQAQLCEKCFKDVIIGTPELNELFMREFTKVAKQFYDDITEMLNDIKKAFLLDESEKPAKPVPAQKIQGWLTHNEVLLFDSTTSQTVKDLLCVIALQRKLFHEKGLEFSEIAWAGMFSYRPNIAGPTEVISEAVTKEAVDDADTDNRED